MKKIFAVALVAMMTMTANAQVYVGGTVGLKSMSCDGTSATSFTINPELGYNLNDSWAIGVGVGYSTNNIAYDKDGGFAGKLDKNVNTFAVSPYVRYTFAKLDKVNFFADGIVSYANTGNSDVKVNAFGVARTRPTMRSARSKPIRRTHTTHGRRTSRRTTRRAATTGSTTTSPRSASSARSSKRTRTTATQRSSLRKTCLRITGSTRRKP